MYDTKKRRCCQLLKQLWNKWFDWRGIRWWRRILLSIPEFCKEVTFFLKKGFTYSAVYNHFGWFIESERDILKEYLLVQNSYPTEFEKFNTEEEPDKGYEKWRELISRMILLLDDMDETNPKYNNMDYEKQQNAMDEAKEEFFQLFGKYFYNLWD